MSVTSIYPIPKEALSQEDLQKRISEACREAKGLRYAATADIHEKPDTVALICSWTSMADYSAWIEKRGRNDDSLVALFDTDLLKQWPVTDISYLQLTSIEEFDAQRADIEATLQSTSGYLGHKFIVQDSANNITVMLVGWDKIESHEKFVLNSTSEKYFQNLEKILSVSNSKMYHLINFRVL